MMSLRANHGTIHEISLFLVVCMICLIGFSASMAVSPHELTEREERAASALSGTLVVVARSLPDGTIQAFGTALELAEFERTSNILKARMGAGMGEICVYGFLVYPSGPGCAGPLAIQRVATDQDVGFCPDITSVFTCDPDVAALYDGSCTIKPVFAVLDNLNNSCLAASVGATLRIAP